MGDNFQQVPTLGGRTNFWFYRSEDGLLIILIGIKETKYIVKPDKVEVIRKRVWGLDETIRYKSSQYTDTHWSHCPSRMYSPMVAQLILKNLT